jgi:hypothetical protein
MKPHIKVIQRNGVDIFVTSSMTMKETKGHLVRNRGMSNAYFNAEGYCGSILGVLPMGKG